MSNIPGLASDLSKRDLAYFLFKRKNQILAVCGVTTLIVTAGSYITARTYRASATVYVVRNLPPIAATVPTTWNIILDRKEVLNSEVDLITSRAVAEKVADILNAENAAADRTPRREPPAVLRAVRAGVQQLRKVVIALGLADPADDPREGLISSLLGLIDVRPAVNSNFITITCKADNPDYAAKVVNTFVRVYLEQRLVLVKRPGLEEFYDQQVDRARQNVMSLEQQTQELKQETGVVTAEDQLKLKLEELSGLNGQLNQVRSERHELRERIAQLRTRLEQEAETVLASRVMQRNPNIGDLEKRRLDLASQRALELNRFQADSPQIQEIDRSIERITEVLTQQPATVISSESMAQNTVRTSLRGDLFRAESDFTAKQARERTLVAEIDAVERGIRRLDADATTLRRMSAEVASAGKIYAKYVEEREEARIARQTDPGVTNVQLVSPAIPHRRPLYPRMLLVMLGALLGLFIGCVLAFISELFGHTLDRREDIERELGLPVLAAVPEFKAIRRVI